jgi:heme-degrading monooxygenase HmoA
LAVIYRWRLKAGMETQFIEAWSTITRLLRDQRGSLGSRLHRGPDDIWYGYAQWPTAAARVQAFATPLDVEASALMRSAIAESFDEIQLTPMADFLVFPTACKL